MDDDDSLTKSINKEYPKYGSVRTKSKQPKIELCNSEDPTKFLTRIDSSIKDAKAKVKKTIDKSTISEDYESSFDNIPPFSSSDNTIQMIKLDRIMTSAAETTPTTTTSTTIITTNTKTNLTMREKPQDSQNKQPISGRRNILITSALPYVNNVPHLGNIVGSVLSGDVFNRYCRLRNYNSLYIGGNDEYGTATETKALEENKTPIEICDYYHAIHSEVYRWFNIDFDKFGRTTNELQASLAQDIFTKLLNNNYLYQDSMEQLFCTSCERFLADRFVNGICPLCQFDDARGDQCDSCGKLMNAADLKQPKCKLCKSTPIIKESRHFFFDLPKLQEKLEVWFEDIVSRAAPPPKALKFFSGTQTSTTTNPDGEQTATTNKDSSCDTSSRRHHLLPQDTHWTNTARAITETWLRDGLKPRCITRDLKWGTKVPHHGFEDKVFYVWFDAPIGYLSISACYTDQWAKWWLGEEAEQDVELYEFMAKDNVPFHSIIFPATQMATGDRWVKLKGLISTDYLNYENSKFSKSRGIGIFGTDAKETGIPADVWRFYLMYIRPEGQDSSFMWDDFRDKVNGELVNNLGNFINRAVSFTNNNFAKKLNSYEPTDEDLKYLAEVGQNMTAYEERLERVMLRDGLKPILSISRLGNQLIQANEPWVLVKGSPEQRKRAETVMYLAVNTVAVLCLLLKPYMPHVASLIKEQLKLDTEQLVEMACDWMPLLLPVGHEIGEPAILFQRVDALQVKDFQARFGAKEEKKAQESKKAAKKAAKKQKQPTNGAPVSGNSVPEAPKTPQNNNNNKSSKPSDKPAKEPATSSAKDKKMQETA